MKEAETVLSEVKVYLNTKGNIEVEYNHVPPSDFIQIMEKKLSDYENTYIIGDFLERVNTLSNEYYDNVNKLLSP
tara:strand:+ start:100 stop:324 length:225 start_codon:yes stop_codon:yes gene_type:complete